MSTFFPIFKYSLIGLIALSTLLLIATMGKQRKPTTPTVVIVSLLVNAGIIVGLFVWPTL